MVIVGKLLDSSASNLWQVWNGGERYCWSNWWPASIAITVWKWNSYEGNVIEHGGMKNLTSACSLAMILTATGVQQFDTEMWNWELCCLSVLCNWIACVKVEVSEERLWSLSMICVVLVHESNMAMVDCGWPGHTLWSLVHPAPWVCYSSWWVHTSHLPKLDVVFLLHWLFVNKVYILLK